MKKHKNNLLILFLIIMILLSLFGCNGKITNIQNMDDSISYHKNSFNTKINKYKYINGYATFSSEIKDGYVIFTDIDYSKDDTYYGKVRWNDENKEDSIISAYQVISVNGKEVYSEQLKIESPVDSSDTWDHLANYSYSVKAKCSEKDSPYCYIKLVDKNNIEYYVMLTPVEKFNHDGYSGSAVYIVDKESNDEFWYDDLIE